MADSPDSTQMPPPGWERPPPWRLLLDIVHWALRDSPKRANGKWPIGAAIRRQVAERAVGTSSGADAIAKFCAPIAYQTELPFIAVETPQPPPQIDTIAGIGVVPCDPPAMVPISTSQHEDTQLVWNDPKPAHRCASGAACAAAQLPNSPGPLPYYVPEGSSRAEYEQPAFCLMCIRADATAVAAVYSKVVQCSKRQLGRAAVAVPPFQNLINCDGGYQASAAGVKPDQCIFAPISIVGPHKLPVSIDGNGTHYIDQSTIKWPGFLRQSARPH